MALSTPTFSRDAKRQPPFRLSRAELALAEAGAGTQIVWFAGFPPARE